MDTTTPEDLAAVADSSEATAATKMKKPAANGNNNGTQTIKTFIMGRTSNAIKSKFLSVLGNSTDLINGISNKVHAKHWVGAFVWQKKN